MGTVRRMPRAAESLEGRRLFAAVLLNEIEVDPPGVHGPHEYAELRGEPGAAMDSVYLLSVEGDRDASPGGAGRLDLAIDLGGRALGPDGLLVIKGTAAGHAVPATTPLVIDPQLDLPGSAMENGTNSFLLVRSEVPIEEGIDLDPDDDGSLDLPAGCVVLDAIGWSDGGAGDVVYGGVALEQSAGAPPDAATRFPGNDTPLSAAAWYNAELLGDTATRTYDAARCSVNFPSGGGLTPGAPNVPSTVPPPPRLNEVVVNPAGPDDGFEYIELEGAPGQVLARMFFISMEGDSTATPGGPGRADMVVGFNGRGLGANGLLVVKGTAGGHPVPPETAVVTDPQLDTAGGGLENGSNSFLLVASVAPIVEGTDYDTNDDGVLELPAGAVVVDAVGWSDGGAGDIVYGGVRLQPAGGGAAHAASRFGYDPASGPQTGWYGGSLLGATPSDLAYDPARVTAESPAGGRLTPGEPNFPPRAGEVLVAGTGWTPQFFGELAKLDLGDGGYRVPAGAGNRTVLGWRNVDQISVRLAGGATPRQEDLRVRGVRVGVYTPARFAYDPASRTATWTLAAPLGHDTVDVTLGRLGWQLEVVPGDVNRDGVASAADVAFLRARLGKTVRDVDPDTGRYSVFCDVNGNGVINSIDLLLLRTGGRDTKSALARATRLLLL